MTKILLRKPLAHPDGHLRKAAAPNKPKPPSQAEIQARRLANKLIDEEQQARRIAQAAKVQPLVASYFSGKSMLTETVFLDGVECFRPLAIGIHKTVLAWLRSQPETVGCSKTLLKDLVEAVLEPHVSKPQYRAGLSRFRERFDLDGNIAGIVSEKERFSALVKTADEFQCDFTSPKHRCPAIAPAPACPPECAPALRAAANRVCQTGSSSGLQCSG